MRIFLAAALAVALAVAPAALPTAAHAQHWRDDTATTIGTTAEWTNKVEIADVDGDGWLDILLANGRGYQTPGTAEACRVFRNKGLWTGTAPFFEETTAQVFGAATGHARVIKVRDLDGDGDGDVFVGNTYGDASRLYRRDAAGWTDVSATALPAAMPRVGDADFGDVDGDGDLDLVLADWGTGSLMTGAPPRLYLNSGSGTFTDATTTNLPSIAVKWSWELDLVDVDDDFDLDLLVASKLGTGSFLLRNDGAGHFTDDSAAALPQFTNNYEFEAMDLDGDDDLDLATINDGTGGRNHLFRNEGGRFVDATDTLLTGTANPPDDDNMVAYLDVDADGDADMIVGSLGGPDRLLVNDGSGRLTLATGAIPGNSPGTLGIAVGDLDGDHRVDVVDGQGETAFPDLVYRATDLVAADTRAPHVGPVAAISTVDRTVRARVHDTTSLPGELQLDTVTLQYRGDATGETPMRWYGEYLWRADLPSAGNFSYQVCATDLAGTEACSAEITTGASGGDAGTGSDGGTDPGTDPGGCCGASRTDPRASVAFAFGIALAVRWRRRARRSRTAP
ncbi:MAG TPA: VCBS repeat-containing protein [Kofleriaceae bacterium]|nr:VCBS repeat-containing protein [Kofleriaceae bacterium]